MINAINRKDLLIKNEILSNIELTYKKTKNLTGNLILDTREIIR